MAAKALSVSTANTLPPALKVSSQTVGIIFILGELMLLIKAVVWSSEWPMATINSSQIGSMEVIASTIG